MNAPSFGPAMRLFATIAIVAVLTPLGRDHAINLSIGPPQASAQHSGLALLAQGRCVNGRCFAR